jgi:excisionase family DNA binding protein
MSDEHDDLVVTDRPAEKLAYNVGQAAEAIGLSKSGIYHAIADGRVPARKVLGRVVILHEDLQRLVKG